MQKVKHNTHYSDPEKSIGITTGVLRALSENTIKELYENSESELLELCIVIAGNAECVSRQIVVIGKQKALEYLGNALIDEALQQGCSKKVVLSNIATFYDIKKAHMTEKRKAQNDK